MTEGYVYRAPVNSYFYYKVLSPLCLWLVTYLFPDWATPDLLTLAGFFCASVSSLAVANERWLLAGVFWQLYCIFDNCDGKQARRLKMSSHGGEFMDHASDSLVTSMAGFVMVSACLNRSTAYDEKIFHWIALPFIISVGNIPYYLGIWGQAAYGSVIMGVDRVVEYLLGRSEKNFGENQTPEILSVDEYNFFLVPGLCYLRAFCTDWFTTSHKLPFTLPGGINKCSLGLVVASGCMIVAFAVCPLVMFFLLRGKRCQFFIVPLSLWAVIAIYCNNGFIVTACVFSLISFEVLVKQLKIHTHTNCYMLYPILLQLVFVFDVARLFGQAPGSSDCSDYRAKLIMCLSTGGIMFTYKNVIHARNNEPNIPWVLTKKKEFEAMIREQFQELWGRNKID